MTAVLLARDVVGVAATGRDEAVQALPELGEGDPRPGQAHRQIPLRQIPRPGRGALLPAPSAVRAPDQPGGPGVRLGPDAAQPLPGLRGVQHTAAAVHRVPCGASSDTYSPKESTSEASSSFPLSADASEGRPMTPDFV